MFIPYLLYNFLQVLSTSILPENTTTPTFTVWYDCLSTDATPNITRQVVYFTLTADKVPIVFLERKYDRYELTLVQKENHQIYTAPVNNQSCVKFSWPEAVINGVPMNLILSQGSLKLQPIDGFIFMTPINRLNLTTDLITSEIKTTQETATRLIEPVSTATGIIRCDINSDYWYLIIPFVICLLGSRADSLVKLWRSHLTRDSGIFTSEGEFTDFAITTV